MGNPASVEFSYQATAALLLRVLARPTILFVLSATLAEHMQMCMFCLILTRTGFDCFHGFIGGGGKATSNVEGKHPLRGGQHAPGTSSGLAPGAILVGNSFH